EAFMLNIQPFLCGDALADFSREEHDMALKYASTRCAQVMTTQQVIQAWIQE
ncbi:isochorismatase family protein, partial [Klebsiella pneumoniae]